MGLSSTKDIDPERVAIGWRLASAGDEQDAANWAYEHMDALITELAALTRELAELRAHDKEAVDLTIDQAVEIGRLTVELTHRVGWEERCLRAEAALRQILEDPEAKILDSHRDDGWEALGRQASALRIEDECDAND